MKMILILILNMLPAAALAQPKPAPKTTDLAAPVPAPAQQKARFTVAPKLGLFEPTSSLSGAFFVGVEAGYLTPALDDKLAVVLELDWVRPRGAGGIADARVLSSGQTYTLGDAEFGVLLSAVYRLEDMVPRLTPYGGLGPGLYFHRTATNSFGNTYVEKEGRMGFQLLAGGDYVLGPGAGFVELRYHFTRVNNLATGDANVGGFLALGFGYRLRF